VFWGVVVDPHPHNSGERKLAHNNCDGELNIPISHFWGVGPPRVSWGIKLPHRMLVNSIEKSSVPATHVNIIEHQHDM
jgi:hypothetical protein